MTNTERRYTSRSNRPKKSNGMNKILNALIGLVVVLIVITAGIIFFGNDDNDEADSKNKTEETATDLETAENEDEPELGSEEIGSEEVTSEEESAEGSTEDDETTTEDDGSVTTLPSDDESVSDSIDDTAWEPIGTSQTGEHKSVYTEGHVDWDEKVKALAYATGLSADNMIVWRIENGGGPQKSVGVVSSNDKEEKYRVYLQWVDQEGWKPEKLETLKTLDGAY